MKLNLKSNAKINIGLNVLGKFENGYHELEMCMVPIGLSDELIIEFFDESGELTISCSIDEVPCDESNIIYKVYNRFFDYTGISKKKVNLNLIKNIPLQAGLGGGSSNGAFFLKALNNYYTGELSIEKMIEITKDIGADIPFFLINQSSFVKGIGEEIEKIENGLNSELILIKPNFGISTKIAFENVQNLEKIRFADMNLIKQGLKFGDLELVKSNIENSLEQSAKIFDKRVMEFEKRLAEFNEQFFMSGSGSCYYALLDKKHSREVYEKLKNKMGDCFISLTKIL